MNESPSQFACECLDIPIILPCEKEKGNSDICWLCGGSINKNGWSIKSGIKDTFTNHNRANVLSSDTICSECITLFRGESWNEYIKKSGIENLKGGRIISWRSYSHAFCGNFHKCPTRSEWRDILLNPPDPPFLFVVAVSGKKHLIFRSKISHSKYFYHVQFEEDSYFIDRTMLNECIKKFEEMYSLGFNKKSILTGIYNQKQILSVGISKWGKLENEISKYRNNHLETLTLTEFCARKND